MCRQKENIVSPGFYSKSVSSMWQETRWCTPIIQLTGRWVNFCVKLCKWVNELRIIPAQYQPFWHASESLFLFMLCSTLKGRLILFILSRKKKTISSVLKSLTWRLLLCCAVKGRAHIQNCRETNNNMDQHNKSHSAEREKKKTPKTQRSNIYW